MTLVQLETVRIPTPGAPPFVKSLYSRNVHSPSPADPRLSPGGPGRDIEALELSRETFIVKTPSSEEQRAAIRNEVWHTSFMAGLRTGPVRYPRSELLPDDRLKRPYIVGKPFRDRGDAPKDPIEVGLLAKLYLQQLESLQSAGFAPHPSISSDFLHDFVVARKARAQDAATQVSDKEVSEALGRYPDVTGRAHLTISVHGDFTGENIIVGPHDDIWFIDTRGIDVEGLPCWDPACDVASLVLFELVLHPQAEAPIEQLLKARGVLQGLDLRRLGPRLGSRAGWYFWARLTGVYGNHVNSSDYWRRMQALRAREMLLRLPPGDDPLGIENSD